MSDQNYQVVVILKMKVSRMSEKTLNRRNQTTNERFNS